MKYLIFYIILAFNLVKGFGQSGLKFDHGNNDTYTPFKQFSAPVAPLTPLDAPPPTGEISNLEVGIEHKSIKGANAGIHFPKGTPGVKTVRYDLYVTDTVVNYTGKKRKGIAVNGSIPAPTLVFTIGDTALIYVHNNGDEPTAVHWHGVQLPERMDGVAFLTQLPIPPHTTHIYKFPVVQAGTYWYHSHFSLQEQIGLYGALIFNKRTEPPIPTIPVVLSDWSDMKPKEIERQLHTANDWFSIKKGAVQSYSEAISAGKLGVKLTSEWKRMKAMDVSDVYYERFLANGSTSESFPAFKGGDKVRLRIVNGAASSYFWLSYGGGQLMVVANDGNDVEPVMVDRMIVGPSETYDVVLTIPETMQYEFRATAEDRTGSASIWLGSGMKMPAQKLPKLKYFRGMKMMNDMMKMNGDMEPMGMKMSLQEMDMNSVMYPEMRNSGSHNHQGTPNVEEHDMDGMIAMNSMKDSGEMDHMKQMKTEAPKMNTANNEKTEQVYTCPMHPKVTSSAPGKCEQCGMDLVKKDMGGNKVNAMGMGKEIPKEGILTLNYNMLQATESTVLPSGPWKELKFELTGNMNRYVWTMDNKTVSESDKIKIKQGENVRIILYNNSMMRHPMHLHGHDFRVRNKFGDRSPMKNVLDIMPMETDTLEFSASESGDWFFHCHILYHMMSGMGRIFSYENSAPNPEIPHPQMAYKMLKMDDRMFHLTAQNDFATNGNDGSLMYANTRWGFQSEWRLGYNADNGYEVETHFGRYIGKMQWLFPYVGIDWRYRRNSARDKSFFGQKNTKDDRKVLHVGVEYTLPWLAVLDASVDHNGYFRMQLMREDIALTPRLRAAFMVNTDREYMVGGKYILTKNFGLSTHYDSDMGWGAGLTITY
ncbi:MAG TPA: multicopper oxidase domain-containing protein [Arachidicoccus sp.]|nr:multicopper oxidase domain-containing protein [Arachidicoccus sp.]